MIFCRVIVLMSSHIHIVFAWELGENYGHILKNMALARPLLLKGYKISFILRELSHVSQLKIESEIKIFQAPIWPKRVKAPGIVKNYSDLLLGIGYDNVHHLKGILAAWRTLFELLEPDLVICDHAPSALIAAKSKKIKVINFGTGFEVPEPQSPFSTLRPWDKIASSELVKSDQSLLQNINTCLLDSGVPSVTDLMSILRPDSNLLCTLPEIDPYIGRKNTPYWGPMMEVDKGASPEWPKTDGMKVFIYLRNDLKFLPHLLKALEILKYSVVIHFIGGVLPNINGLKQLKNIVISQQPLKMSEVMKQADLLICHAGHGVVANALLHGLPLMLLPTQQEQKNTVIRLVKLGIAIELNGKESQMQMKKKFRAIEHQNQYRENAQVVAKKYIDFDLAGQVDQLIEHCEHLLEK